MPSNQSLRLSEPSSPVVYHAGRVKNLLAEAFQG